MVQSPSSANDDFTPSRHGHDTSSTNCPVVEGLAAPDSSSFSSLPSILLRPRQRRLTMSNKNKNENENRNNNSSGISSFQFEPRVSFSDVISECSFSTDGDDLLDISTHTEYNLSNPAKPVDIMDEYNESLFDMEDFIDDVKTGSKDEVHNDVEVDNNATKTINLEHILMRTLDKEGYVVVEDLPWKESTSPFRHGSFTGMVNRTFRPHGKGVLVFTPVGKHHESMNIVCGSWYDGKFITDSWKENIFAQVATKIEQEEKDSNCVPKRTIYANIAGEDKERKTDEKYTTNESPANQQEVKLKYSIGETLCVDHAKYTTKNAKIVAQLKENDYAFVKRSDNTWSYARVIKKYPQGNDDSKQESSPTNQCNGIMGEYITFALDSEGSTKTIEQKKWKFIRCVSL